MIEVRPLHLACFGIGVAFAGWLGWFAIHLTKTQGHDLTLAVSWVGVACILLSICWAGFALSRRRANALAQTTNATMTASTATSSARKTRKEH